MAVTRTPAIPNAGTIVVSPSRGESLHFTLTCGGPVAIFSFVSGVKGVLFEAPDFGPPKTTYEWDHLKNPSDIQQLEQLTLGLSFFTNAQYHYEVEVRSAGAAAKKIDVSYTGAPTDTEFEFFRVVIV